MHLFGKKLLLMKIVILKLIKLAFLLIFPIIVKVNVVSGFSKKKLRTDGSIEKFKERLVVIGVRNFIIPN